MGPIIEQARQGAPAQPMPQEQPQQAQPQAQAQRKSPAPSPDARAVILAVYGMLYDPRVALGEKIAGQLTKSRDPVAHLANTAFDLTSAAIEKTGKQLEEREFRFAMSMTMRRLFEIAQAVGLQLTEKDAQDASQMIAERMGGGQPVMPGQPAQEAEEPGEAMENETPQQEAEEEDYE